MPANPEHIDAVINRAKEILTRADIVNKAQYVHGINSTSSTIRWRIKQIESGKSQYANLNLLNQEAMQLAGYLYALKENIK